MDYLFYIFYIITFLTCILILGKSWQYRLKNTTHKFLTIVSVNILQILIMTIIYVNTSSEDDFEAKTPFEFLYFATVVQFTIGFGDISPKTFKSRFFVITHIVLSFMLNLFLTINGKFPKTSISYHSLK